MEKLLQLINEYLEKMGLNKVEKYNSRFDYFVQDKGNTIETETVISKKFGFIEWLTKNNKIRLMGDWEFFYDKHGGRYEEFVNWIMHLSIQDDPIEFLVSMLY